METRVPILLITHRGLGEGLLEAAGRILGFRPAIDHLSNDGLSPEDLNGAVEAWLAAHPGPAVILTDLGFGSCTQSARRVGRDRPDVGVVTGVNLPMILAAARSHELEDLDALLGHLEHRGREGVVVFRSEEPR